jgi:hypothetical protein
MSMVPFRAIFFATMLLPAQTRPAPIASVVALRH